MLNFIKTVLFFFFFSSLAMAQWNPAILDDPDILLEMNSEQKALMIEELMEPRFVFNVEIQNFIVKSLLEYWKAEQEDFGYDGLQVNDRIKSIHANQYTELGYLIQYSVYTEQIFKGTVFESVLRSLSKRVEEIIKSNDINDLVFRKFNNEADIWAIKIVSKELILRGYSEMLKHMLGFFPILMDVDASSANVKRKMFIKSTEAEYEYLMKMMKEEARQNIEDNYIRTLKQYAFSDIGVIPIYFDDLGLLDALIQRIIVDIRSKDIQTRNMAVYILLSEELGAFLRKIDKEVYCDVYLEVFSKMCKALDDYSTYVKSPVNMNLPIYPKSKQILLKEATRSISVYRSYRLK